MKKTPNLATHWGIRVAAFVLALLLFSGSALLGVTGSASAFLPLDVTPTVTSTATAAPTPTPTSVPTTPPTPTVAPTATSQPQPTATQSQPKATPTSTRAVILPPNATPTATATTTSTATVAATASATTTATTPEATALATTTTKTNSDSGADGLPLPALIAVMVVLAVIVLGIPLYIVMRQRSTQAVTIPGVRRSRVVPAGAALGARDMAPVHHAPQNGQQQQVQGFASSMVPQLMENRAPYQPSHGDFTQLMSDTAAAQVMQMAAPPSGSTSDMNPLTLDFQQFVSNTSSGAAFSPLPPLPQEMPDATEEVGDATIPVQSVRPSMEPAQPEHDLSFLNAPVEPTPTPVPPTLPWELQPAISEAAQDDPVLGALKRQVQMGLFSVPEREDEDRKSQG